MDRPFDDTTRRNIAELCAAFMRATADQPTPALKRAAVAVVLVEAGDAGGGTAFMLTRRAASLRAHGAQWALPGGRCDAGETTVVTALRELHEELGLKLGPDDVLGELDDYPTRSGYLVTPVVVWAAGGTILPNPQEVASVHAIALDAIERADAFDFASIPESTRPLIRFHYDGDMIHAPTAAMIYQFRELLCGRQTRVAELEQPVFAWK